MIDSNAPMGPIPTATPESNLFVDAEAGHQHVHSLLAQLQDDSHGPSQSRAGQSEAKVENQLAVVRLGMATSLFYSLRTKHPATAAHSLRVALFCSGWAERLGLAGDQRDRIEVAALLHDIGKIGIPDRVLRKPGKLTVDEQLMMDLCPEMGCQILAGCTSDQELLDIIRYGNTWYESRRHGEGPRGDALPLGSRMLAIVNAFDAMTTEHVYRPALSRDRAIVELVRGSGGQFDARLVADFGRMLEDHPEMLQGVVVNRWLQQLRPGTSQGFWTGNADRTDSSSKSGQGTVLRRETHFNKQLLHTLKDGVAFTDAEGNVTEWNDALASMTGVSADAMLGRQWSISAIGLRDADRDEDTEQLCPLKQCFQSSGSVKRPMLIEQPGEEIIPVHVEVSPVRGDVPGTLGTVIVVHDLSDREHLQKRLESLDQQTKTDGLTNVANRAHFDATLDELTAITSAGGPTFSLVICDIDHFKRINDVHGHPAGDEALKTFASVLASHSRDGDLVARYGGEEFCLLAANCDNSTAAKRAEALRIALEHMPIPSLGGEQLTASFGVTEFQSGDSPETVLARADRALLKAKDNGRNRVVQLGLGKMSEISDDDSSKHSWLSWFTGGAKNSIDQVDILTPVPIDLAIEKLRGFIADHDAEIINVSENQLSLKLTATCTIGGRRRIDSQIAMHVKLTLSNPQPEEQLLKKMQPGTNTKVHVEMKPIRNRDRRRRELEACSQQVVASLRSYLMGEVLRRSQSTDLT
ncbi:sensor domain-containing diguanylate cyclase/phosphohydrolase [Stieleria varia]|uniref:diguanylate cyclase n=1 Tax=Stieleria varia TaxID=2528005 RepID=A0A5C6AUA0_9BACT|nr:diguanylate cyclase [Stieleria varia]TWU02779.1 putative diguanylate cyclase YdaM [Stieleria varia]